MIIRQEANGKAGCRLYRARFLFFILFNAAGCRQQESAWRGSIKNEKGITWPLMIRAGYLLRPLKEKRTKKTRFILIFLMKRGSIWLKCR